MNDLIKKLKPYFPYILALLGGMIMTYGFAPYGIATASITSCVVFLWCLGKSNKKTAFLIGLCYGIGMFGYGVNWVYVSIHDFGNASPILATLITSAFILFLSLYPAFLASLLVTLFPQNNNARNLLAFPVLWVLFEILRGWFLTGFPWMYMGYSQIENQLVSFAPIGGVWLVSWAAVFIAAILYSFINYFYQLREDKKYLAILGALLLAVWGAAFGLRSMEWTTTGHKKLNVTLIQGNIAQLLRWDPQYINHIIEIYQTLTATALNNERSDVIIWPEGAIPVPLPTSQPLLNEMGNLLQARDMALITGLPTQLPNQQYYNTLYVTGVGSGVYYKEHLVPFGEYVPFDKQLRGLISFFNLPMSSFIEGPQKQGPLNTKDFLFAPAICYEIAYPLFVQSMSKGADAILTVSNDTWFGRSIGPFQHLQIAQFRAIETGKYVVRATNTGLTAIIDDQGKIVEAAEQFAPQSITAEVVNKQGQTPWVRYGIWPLIIAMTVVFSAALIMQSTKKQ
ncbi:apolipoprotein N-acyltransferase [Candidatus Berkiella aquae]|uniref:Apolipoprotein N-acyltransferase n=1 Tax=Candidatus Berkiella aquae TaxID=295108 RepID=A0A0Q9YZS7_9GAMM|nr:apolipoprotein N-acyltransferase [Candidatus Berkiella aquae]MCS5710592.1 apolipoprotein N-acyltransferase [Candidatus Berkiella aquae]